MILFELIRGQGSHIFPRPVREWIREVEACGTTFIKCLGQEFLLPDRLFVRFAQTLSGRRGNPADETQDRSPRSYSDSYSLAHRAYWRLRRIIVPFSAWIEPAVEKICPVSMATHAIFVFQKKS